MVMNSGIILIPGPHTWPLAFQLSFFCYQTADSLWKQVVSVYKSCDHSSLSFFFF